MWYAANLLFQSEHSTVSDKENLWEESIRLIQADSTDQAMQKAKELGQLSEVSYSSEGTDHVKWRFVQIERIYEIDDEYPKDGTEAFSRFLRASEVESILTPFDD